MHGEWRSAGGMEDFRYWHVAALVAASAVFIAAQISISGLNGFWNDELFSALCVRSRVAVCNHRQRAHCADSNPPLFPVLLDWTRALVGNDIAAIVALNCLAIAIAASLVLYASRRRGLTGLAVVGIVAFLLSGPIQHYALEGRTYVLAMSLGFVASWYTALAVAAPRPGPGVWSFAVLGVVSPLLHLYAGLLCGVLAAGLLCLAFWHQRRDLVAPGLALGLSASGSLAVWATASMLFNMAAWPPGISWIVFSLEEVRGALWYVRTLAVGGLPSVALFALLLVLAATRKMERSLLITFGVAFALFLLLPLVASLKWPIIVGRYVLIGVPAILTLVVFLSRAWLTEDGNAPELTKSFLITFVALAVLVVSSSYGLLAARGSPNKNRGGKVRQSWPRCSRIAQPVPSTWEAPAL